MNTFKYLFRGYKDFIIRMGPYYRLRGINTFESTSSILAQRKHMTIFCGSSQIGLQEENYSEPNLRKLKSTWFGFGEIIKVKLNLQHEFSSVEAYPIMRIGIFC